MRSQNRKLFLMVRALSNQEAPCWAVLILLLPPAGPSTALNVALRPVGGVVGRGGRGVTVRGGEGRGGIIRRRRRHRHHHHPRLSSSSPPERLQHHTNTVCFSK